MITSRTADKHQNYAKEIGVSHFLGNPTRKTISSRNLRVSQGARAAA